MSFYRCRKAPGSGFFHAECFWQRCKRKGCSADCRGIFGFSWFYRDFNRMEFLDLGKVKSILSILIWRKHVRNIPYFEFKVEIFLNWGGEFGAAWHKVFSDYFAFWCCCYYGTFKLHKQFYDGPWVKLFVSTIPMSICLCSKLNLPVAPPFCY